MGPIELPDPLEVAASITSVLEGLGVRYLIGGSLASSVHGEPRSTNDVDILVDFHTEHVEPFVKAIRGDYYVSEPAVRAAVKSGGHFNAIHMNAAVKVDLFLAGDDPFNLERLDMRQALQLPTEPESERQWRDVVAILRLQGSRLDQSRLSTWALRLGVSDLLDRAFQEAAETG
jgi:predicted nucleotidyltransferase